MPSLLETLIGFQIFLLFVGLAYGFYTLITSPLENKSTDFNVIIEDEYKKSLNPLALKIYNTMPASVKSSQLNNFKAKNAQLVNEARALAAKNTSDAAVSKARQEPVDKNSILEKEMLSFKTAIDAITTPVTLDIEGRVFNVKPIIKSAKPPTADQPGVIEVDNFASLNSIFNQILHEEKSKCDTKKLEVEADAKARQIFNKINDKFSKEFSSVYKSAAATDAATRVIN